MKALFGPVGHCVLSTRKGDNFYNSAQHTHDEDQANIDLVSHHGEGVSDSVHNHVATQGHCINQSTGQNANHQGNNDFLGDEGQTDGQNWGNN